MPEESDKSSVATKVWRKRRWKFAKRWSGVLPEGLDKVRSKEGSRKRRWEIVKVK
jgi:hypothetical protein